MRILFTIQPAFGHFHAMVPLAQALLEAGHEVAFATGESFGPSVRNAGFQHFPCGMDSDGSADMLERLPEWEAIEAKSPSDVGAQQVRGFVEGLAPRMADDLIPLVSHWQPSLIVRDPMEFGGYVAAETHGLSHASIMWASYIPVALICPESVAQLRRRYRLQDDPDLCSLDGQLVLDFLPSSWQPPGLPYPRVAHRYSVRTFDTSCEQRLPDWIDGLPDQPTVHATLGTTFNRDPGAFLAILDALSSEEINLIVTVGRSVDPSRFGPQPGHIRIEQYIPQTLLLPHCDAVIFHGGFNTLLSALRHGLPMVIAPAGGADQILTGRRCAEVGAGVLVEGSPSQPEAIRGAVKAVLEHPEYRAQARRLQREIEELPDISEAVRRLETLAAAREPHLKDPFVGT